jgi:hypothetical protein
MGVAGVADIGLWIKTVHVHWEQSDRTLTRVSEVGVISQFGSVTVGASLRYRPKGLKVGMQLRNNHQVGPPGHDWRIDFAAAPKNADWTTLVWTPVDEDTSAHGVTAQLGEVFGGLPATRWRGYKSASQMFAPYPVPAPGSEADERLYFRVLLRNFRPHIHEQGGVKEWRVNDVHVVPMVCVLGDIPGFAGHYALGLGAFTVGHGAGAIQFDSQVIAHDAPAAVDPGDLPDIPGPARRPVKRPQVRRPKVTPPRRPRAPKGPRPPRPGPDPAPIKSRRRPPPKRRRR